MADYTLAQHPFPLGDPAPDFELPGVDGQVYSLASFEGSPIVIIVFMCNHCPYLQAYTNRLIALQNEFAPHGVRFLGINPNDASNYPEDDFEHMKVYAERWGLNFPYVRDETQDVARAYRAERTPQVFVFDEHRALRYTGGIDDNYRDVHAVNDTPLFDALTDLLHHREVEKPVAHFIGCSVKWKSEEI